MSSSLVVVTVDCALIFVGDGHGISQADSSLQCRKRVVHGRGICFLVVGALFVAFVWFSLEVHVLHGFDSVLFRCDFFGFV